jgi:transglutaminase-like putative cysteine protease
MGRILQSDEPVMRVRFEKMGSELPLVTGGAPYFRGAALSDYSWHSGRGRRGRWKPYGQSLRLADLPTASPNEADVVQEVIFLSGIKSQSGVSDDIPLFSTYPVYRHRESAGDLQVDERTRQLMIESPNLPDGGRQYRYVVRSGEFSGSQQVRLSVEPEPQVSYKMIETSRAQPGLVATAARVVRDAQAVEPMDKALALEDHFRRPGNYEYDLDPDVQHTPNTDPIEDFVVNHRTGHCEYFASALVFMLRSQGIPARMVVGYHGGEFNSVGSYYLVRQKHAHAWVEAYLEPGEYPVDQLATGSDDSGQYGAWLRLDPTPPDYDLEVEEGETTLIAQIGDMLDYAQLLWTDYVLGLNSQRQRDAIYGPIAAMIATLRTSGGLRIALYVLMGTCGVVVLVWGFAMLARVAGVPRRETVMQSLVRALGLPGRWLNTWWTPGRARAAHRQAMHVAFYERLETLLRREGLIRTLGQTQREFAAAAGGRLADVPQLQAVAGVPRRVAEAFYRVRFGGAPLDSREEQAVEQALRDLESALST